MNSFSEKERFVDPVPVTLAVLVYNQASFISDTLESAFAQSYSNLEILISDDASTDDSLKFIKDFVATNPTEHRVVIRSNSENLGLIGHVNELMQHISNELIVLQAGDDMSRSDRVEVIASTYLAACNPYFYFHSSFELYNNSKASTVEMMNLRPRISKSRFVPWKSAFATSLALGATQAFSHRLFTRFGKIDERCWAEDLILGFRASLLGAVYYSDLPLVKYRSGVGLSKPASERGLASLLSSVRKHDAILRQRGYDALKVNRYDIWVCILLVRSVKRIRVIELQLRGLVGRRRSP